MADLIHTAAITFIAGSFSLLLLAYLVCLGFGIE